MLLESSTNKKDVAHLDQSVSANKKWKKKYTKTQEIVSDIQNVTFEQNTESTLIFV